MAWDSKAGIEVSMIQLWKCGETKENVNEDQLLRRKLFIGVKPCM
jgi:hypothetical protein